MQREAPIQHLEHSRSSVLLTQWSTNHLSFSVCNSLNNEVVITSLLDNYFDLFDFTKQEFDRFIQEQPIFGYSFFAHKAIIDTPYFTLVPSEFIVKDKLRETLQFNMALPSGKLVIQCEELKNADYSVIYALPQSLVEALEQAFPEIKISATAYSILNSLTSNNVDTSSCSIVFSEHDQMVFVDFKNGKINFFNQFDCQSSEDFVYHVLNIYRQLGYHHEKRALQLMGAFAEDGEVVELLKQYVPNLVFMKRTNKLNYTKDVAEMPEHYFAHHYSELL